jgi:hypothetical protein
MQLLRQVVPGLKNVIMLLDPKFTGFHSLWQAIAEVAPTHGITAHAAHASSLEEIERNCLTPRNWSSDWSLRRALPTPSTGLAWPLWPSSASFRSFARSASTCVRARS